MFRAAICDDNLEDLKYSKDLMDEAKRTYADRCELIAFSSPKELLEELDSGKMFDIIILETEYKEMSGIELAKAIYKHNENTIIAYLTNHKEHAFEAFEVSAVHYALKPCTKAFIKELFHRVIKAASDRYNYIIKRTSNGIEKIDVGEITYTESNGHYQYLYLENGERLKLRAKTNELWKDLKDYTFFIRPHCGYIVNMKYITSISSTGIKVGNIELPMAKNVLRTVTKTYLEYYDKR